MVPDPHGPDVGVVRHGGSDGDDCKQNSFNKSYLPGRRERVLEKVSETPTSKTSAHHQTATILGWCLIFAVFLSFGGPSGGNKRRQFFSFLF